MHCERVMRRACPRCIGAASGLDQRLVIALLPLQKHRCGGLQVEQVAGAATALAGAPDACNSPTFPEWVLSRREG